MLARKIERGERLPWQWEEALAEMRDHRLDVQDARKELARRAAGGKPLPYLPLSEIWGDVLPDDPFPEGARPLRGVQGVYRIRIGDYRILFEMKRGKPKILSVGHDARAVARGQRELRALQKAGQ